MIYTAVLQPRSVAFKMSQNDSLTNEAVELLIDITRNKISEGKSLEAFAALLQAIKLTKGEESILEVLSVAKKKVDDDMQLCSEFDSSVSLQEAFDASRALVEQDTILRDQGNEEILKDAFEDGSSVVCTKCGGLISMQRWTAHKSFWCSALG